MGYLEDRLNRKNGLLPPLPTKKEKKPIPKKSAKKLLEESKQKELEKDTELQKWYAKIMESEKPICWETGEKINKNDKLGWHGSIAHILPKADYPSVKTHPLNYMILKMWGGTHGQYDSSWENASKMKVWAYACKIINILYPLLTQEEKRKLPDIILQEIKPEIYNQK
jgi:hypothetical protein